MKAKRVYDLPTRVFHWLFATLFVVAFTIGNTVDDESLVFSYHMIAGLPSASWWPGDWCGVSSAPPTPVFQIFPCTPGN